MFESPDNDSPLFLVVVSRDVPIQSFESFEALILVPVSTMNPRALRQVKDSCEHQTRETPKRINWDLVVVGVLFVADLEHDGIDDGTSSGPEPGEDGEGTANLVGGYLYEVWASSHLDRARGHAHKPLAEALDISWSWSAHSPRRLESWRTSDKAGTENVRGILCMLHSAHRDEVTPANKVCHLSTVSVCHTERFNICCCAYRTDSLRDV